MKLLILFVIIINSIISFSQEENDDYFNENHLRYEDYIYKDSIKAVVLHREGWELSYPALNINSNERLVLSFDEISNDTKDYYFKLIHCTYDWKPSDLMLMEYINGVTEDHISDYKFSFNTVVDYTHYELRFPSEDMQITKSGNYILLVYEDGDMENIVLTKRFFVYEPLTSINARVERSSNLNLIKSHQEVNFIVNTNQLQINDPYSEIKPVIIQNGFWNTRVADFQPNMVKDHEVIYNFNEKCLFTGGSEFRHFDSKDLKYQNQQVREIIFEPPFYHFKLYDDEERRFKIYNNDDDINGKFLIKANYRTNSSIEADYVHAYFTLPVDAPITNGNIYIYGYLTNEQFKKEYRMTYNYKLKAYQLRLMLKQGYYNYEYVLLKDGETKADATYIEGSHYETENDYLILIYYHGFTSDYDRLVGYTVVNSVNR